MQPVPSRVVQRQLVVLVGVLSLLITSLALVTLRRAGASATGIPSSVPAGTRFHAGQTGLRSPNGEYQLVMQTTGDLVVAADNNIVWSAGVTGTGNWASVQGDGNFVIYSPAGKALWNTYTDGHRGSVTLTLANSGALILTTNGTETWSTNQARTGVRLRAGGERLVSPDGQYLLAMRSDGDLTLSAGGIVIWHAGVTGAGNWADVQGDGNFVIYTRAGKALWNTGTSGHPGTITLTVTNNGAVVLATNRATTWSAADPVDAVAVGDRLLTNQYLRSPNGQFQLSMQAGGDLVLTDGGLTAWSSHTSGLDNWAIVQGDGNFVIYNPAGRALWESRTNTASAGTSRLSLTDSGLVLSRSGATTWSAPIKATSLSDAGAAFIGTWEGFEPKPYNDPSDNCTIGYGHLISLSPCTAADDAKWGTITQAEGYALLQQDAAAFARDIVTGFPGLTLIQPQMDALISFTYNVGPGWISGSGLATDLSVSSPDFTNVPAQLERWVYAGGVPLCGLYQRRVSEAHLFTTASYAVMHPSCPPGYSTATNRAPSSIKSGTAEAQLPYYLRRTTIGVAPGQRP